jgi:tetratricopeptide (TPR) repeat protein
MKNFGLYRFGDDPRDGAQNTRGVFQCQTAPIRGVPVALLFQKSPGKLPSSMKIARAIAFGALLAASGTFRAAAQDDPAREYFSAYQEFQRAERLEREGRNGDAISKFRYVATQLEQIKAQAPDWQPLVIDFRLAKTKEAIVRLEGSLDNPTLGPPPDLAMSGESEEVLPPVRPAGRDGLTAPSISISPVQDDAPVDVPPPADAEPAATPSDSGGESQNLREQLRAEQSRNSELQSKMQQGEADLSAASMELEKTKVLVVDLTTKLRQLEESGGVSNDTSAAAKEELEKLTAASKELEDALAAANAEKEELSGKIAENAKQVEELTARTEKAEARAAELETERGTLAAERDTAVKEAESAKAEVQTLTTRVTELEEERTQLIAARDTAQQEAAEAKSALEKSADLIEANKQLEEKLAAAAKQIEGMESDAAAKGEVISGLNADLDKVRAELAAAQTKLKDDRERFDQLQLANDQLLKEYDEVTGALAAVKLGDVTAAEAKLIQQENEVLRGIIMRQIKEQARREQAYRLAQEEMERLEIRSDTLNDKINQLAKPTLELSAAEQEMLKRPVVTVLHESTDKISAQIEMLKPSGDEATAAADGSVAAPEQAAQTDAAAASDLPATTDAASPATSPDPTAATETAAAADSLGTEMTPEVTALITEARDQFVRGNFAAAEDLYQKFVELQPNNVVALANLGVSQFRQGKLTAAQLALEKALAVDPKDAFTLTTLGAVMIEQNRIEDAIGYLERANESQADDAITLNYLGVASSQLGQFGKAEQSLRRAITVNPEYAEAHFNLAVIYATAKPPSIALAKRHYEKAIELGSTPDKRLASMLQGDPGS